MERVLSQELTVGDVSKRTGISVSALHFYERKGLIRAHRSASNHRVYPRSVIRRVTIIQIAQRAGLSLRQIADALSVLPDDKATTGDDWARVSSSWRDDLSQRITLLTSLRDTLTECIGCGCLSVAECPLANPDDALAKHGAGAHLLSGQNTV